LGGAAGMHLTITLPAGSRELEIAERAAHQNLWLWPLSRYYFGKGARPGFVLGFGSASVKEIGPAIRKLRGLIG
jgi:GntR family transcriptional regulator / MocR family aminotransferase